MPPVRLFLAARTRLPSTSAVAALLLPSALLLACGDKDDDTGGIADDTGAGTDTDADTDTDGGTGTVDDDYVFDSAFTDGSSVSYGGQVMRQLLIHDLAAYLSDLTGRIDSGSYFPVAGDVQTDLDFYLAFDSSAYGSLEHGFDADPAVAQQTYDDVSTDKDLVGKLAGNDEVGQHVDWSTGFVGWGEVGSTTPEGLVRTWAATIDDQAVAWASGDLPLGPDGSPVPAVYVTPQGHDLQQLTEKFLRGAVSFSQGADDYLDDDLEGKGLNSSHLDPGDGSAYTELEHQWDEGFGYFGAARSYHRWTDDQIADTPARDVDGDGTVDLATEVCWGHSTNAAKRDRGAVAATDYTAVAWEGFHQGRALLSATAGQELDADQKAELQGWRDQAVGAWEAAIAATVVHYINDTLQDMGAIGTDDYAFADHAKHWSELKGFALSLQFNPRSPLSDAELVELHALIGDAPVLAPAGEAALSAYAQDLRDARTLVGDAYGFDAANLGDDDGIGGW